MPGPPCIPVIGCAFATPTDPTTTTAAASAARAIPDIDLIVFIVITSLVESIVNRNCGDARYPKMVMPVKNGKPRFGGDPADGPSTDARHHASGRRWDIGIHCLPSYFCGIDAWPDGGHHGRHRRPRVRPIAIRGASRTHPERRCTVSYSPGLTASIQESAEYQRESQRRREGVPDALIVLSRHSGMDAADLQVFEAMSRSGWLIVVRCPKPDARAWHGVFGPKTGATSAKSGSSGLVVTAGRIMVSDYDLMSVWRRSGAGWDKLFIAPEGGAKRGPLTPQAHAFMVEANIRLRSRLQHGCQDDFHSPLNRGVQAADNFAAFSSGQSVLMRGPSACEAFYRSNRLAWPYDVAGRFVGSARAV
jgi:hypothetical protein